MTTTTNIHKNNLTGIGGWLILVAIRIVFGAISLLFFIASNLKDFVFSGDLNVLSSIDSPDYIPGFLASYIVEFVINTAFLVGYCYLVYLFFTKNYKTPKFFIVIEIAYVVFLIVDMFYSIVMFDYEVDNAAIKEIIKNIIGCCIWVPYFLVSVRVKNTFVNGRPNYDTIEHKSSIVS